MLYEMFLEKFNSYEIKSVKFKVEGYAHYNNCCLFHQIDTINLNKKIHIIVCKLTNDEYEKVSFLNKFNEEFKLFDFGRKGKFTLKQIWDKVCITEIKYSE